MKKTMTGHAQKLWLTTILFFFWGNTFSQNISQDTVPVTDSVAYRQQLREVTIAAFYTPYSLTNIPAPVNYISSLQLESGDALTPVEVINRVPGIIMHHGTFNTNRLTIRGIGSRTPYSTSKIKAYFGDIPLTSGEGETTLEDLENEAIERVEIIKGPASSLYGAALGGALLFYPKEVDKNFLKGHSTAGSYGTLKNTVSAGISQGQVKIFTLYSNLKSNGYRENNQTRRQNLMLHTQIAADKKISGSIMLKWTKMKAFIPSSLNLEMFNNSPELAAINWQEIHGYENYKTGQLGASVKYQPNKFTRYSIAAFGQFRNADELRPFNKLEESSHFVGSRGSYQKNFVFNLWQFNLVAGYEIFREKYNWQTLSNEDYSLFSDNHEKRNYENYFLQVEFNRNSRFIVSSGININNTRYIYTDSFLQDGDQSGKYSYDPVISQRIGFNLRASDTWAWFGNLSHGFSPPTLQETLLPEGSINPEIKPEQGWNIESGIRGNINSRLWLEMTYYRIYVSDLLVARRTAEDAYVGVNAGQSVHPGFEGNLQYIATTPGSYPACEFSGNITIANYHFSDFTDNGTDYSGKSLPGTARQTFLLATSIEPWKNLEMKVSHRYMGKMAANDANSVYSNAYGLTNMELGFTHKKGKVGFEVKGGINNLLDVHYASMLAINAPSFGGSAPRYYYPGNPRNYFLSLAVNFLPEKFTKPPRHK